MYSFAWQGTPTVYNGSGTLGCYSQSMSHVFNIIVHILAHYLAMRTVIIVVN